MGFLFITNKNTSFLIDFEFFELNEESVCWLDEAGI